jgi:hypothetical protein
MDALKDTATLSSTPDDSCVDKPYKTALIPNRVQLNNPENRL